MLDRLPQQAAVNAAAAGSFWSAPGLEAELQASESLAGLLGPDHPDVALARAAEGENLRRLGRLDEAQQLLAQATAVSDRSLGVLHPTTIEQRNSLARTLLAR